MPEWLKELGWRGAMRFVSVMSIGALGVLLYGWMTKHALPWPTPDTWEAVPVSALTALSLGGFVWWVIGEKQNEEQASEDAKRARTAEVGLEAAQVAASRTTKKLQAMRVLCNHLNSKVPRIDREQAIIRMEEIEKIE